MALTIDEISALTEKLWVPLIADNVFTSNPLMARLWTRGPKVEGGTSIHAPLMYAKVGAAGAMEGFDQLSTTADDQFTAVTFQWKEYYAAGIVSVREMLQNSGAPAQINHVSAKMQAAEMTLRDLMGTGCYSDGVSNPKLIDGLEAVCSVTNTYPSGGGGLLRTAETWWQAGFRDASVNPIPVTEWIQSKVGLLTEQPNSPTLIVVTQELFDNIFGNYTDLQRFEDDMLASLGFETILFRRIPIVADSHCPGHGNGANNGHHMYFLNENFFQLYSHSQENFRFEGFRKPVNQKVNIAYIFWTGNLVCNNPRFQGVSTNVKTSALT